MCLNLHECLPPSTWKDCQKGFCCWAKFELRRACWARCRAVAGAPSGGGPYTSLRFSAAKGPSNTAEST